MRGVLENFVVSRGLGGEKFFLAISIAKRLNNLFWKQKKNYITKR